MSTRRSSRRSTVASTLATSNTIISLEDGDDGEVEDVVFEGSSTRSDKNDENENTCNLFLECEEEPLSAAQLAFQIKRKQDYKEQLLNLQTLASRGASIKPQSDGSVVFRSVTETVGTGPAASTAATTPVNPANLIPVSSIGGQPIQLPSHHPVSPSPNYRLLMDPRTGRILGTINGSGQVSTGVRQPAPPRLQGPTTILNRVPAPRQPRVSQVRSVGPSKRTVTPAQVVDLTRGSSSAAPASGGSSSGGGGHGKNKFPCLMVHPKPQETQVNFKRPELDQKVKSLLVLTPAKLTEWLIQQGLVFSEQTDSGVKLKLGMLSDAKRAPNSGGYVWLNEETRNKFVSVFKGSLFETIIQPPSVCLKLMYHWVCQTNLSNVLAWVKVDQVTVDTFYRHLRCLCTAAVQEEVVNFGGKDGDVELGVISLGTTTSDGNRREVKVEVLGVLDRRSGRIRLRATEPVSGASQADRFARIFKPVPTWVRRDSRVITDFSIDRESLSKLGYTMVIQNSATARDKSAKTNSTIMEYLKKVVPRMFQNSLSNLSTHAIQQFLDELTFREIYGKGPLLCFDNLIQKVAAQTSHVSKKSTTMSTRLRNIADNPFGDYRLTFHQQPPPSNVYGIDALPPSLRQVDSFGSYMGMGSKRDFDADIDLEITKRMKTQPTVDLESYYYGTIQGDITILVSEFKADMAFKCHLCKKVFMNNIEFMKHLSLHVENERATAVDLADLCQCKYCLKDFESTDTMTKHMEDEHYKGDNPNVCRICLESFKATNHLIYHMNRSHVVAELPYSCEICGFRTSIHREVVDHFTEAHDRTDKLQCPRCLKTFCLFSDKGYNSTVAAAFMSHLQAHQDARKVACKKCCLAFKDEKKVKAHAEKDHLSFKSFDGLESYQYLGAEKPTKMPRPDERGLKLAPKKSYAPKLGHVQQTAFAAQNLEDLAMYDVDKDDNCMECGKKFTTPGHFNAYLCCTKCRYSSCCSKSLSIHVQLFHGPKRPEFTLGNLSLVEKEIFCCCGFKTNSGNKMAKHLVMSRCMSAYPSLEGAQKAALPMDPNAPDDDIDSYDPNEVMAKAYMSKKEDGDESSSTKRDPSQDGPLAFLGLQQQKPDEAEGSDAKEDNTKVNSEEDGEDSSKVDDKEKSESAGKETAPEPEKPEEKSPMEGGAEKKDLDDENTQEVAAEDKSEKGESNSKDEIHQEQNENQSEAAVNESNEQEGHGHPPMEKSDNKHGDTEPEPEQPEQTADEVVEENIPEVKEDIAQEQESMETEGEAGDLQNETTEGAVNDETPSKESDEAAEVPSNDGRQESPEDEAMDES